MNGVAASDNPFFAEFLDDFFAESEEHLTVIRRGILALDAAIGQPRVERTLLNELLRSFHTLKGLSGMVGVQAVEQLAHQTESYVRALSQEQVVVTAEALSTLAAGTRMIEHILAAYRSQQALPDIAPLVAQLAGLLPTAPASPNNHSGVTDATSVPALSAEERAQIADAQQRGTPLWCVIFVPAPQLTERGINVDVIRQRLQALGTIVRAVPQVLGPGKIAFEFLVAGEIDTATSAAWGDDGLTYAHYQPPPEAPPALATSTSALAAAPSPMIVPSNVVRVDLARLDEVVRLVGELVISRARLKEQLQPLEPSVPVPIWRVLQETTVALERQLRDLRQGVFQMRLVPIGETFARMQFVIHDLARERHKQIRLELHGQETEIDKFVVERMLDPLLHLVRNAVDHGLEPTDERTACGKPAVGTLALRATAGGDVVAITIEDDGRGIDTEHVASRARALGILGADEPLNPALLLDVICAPGFSTREHTDRVSGRGVGMEVVKQRAQELGGLLTLDTAVGRGTRFSIQLPLTLTIVEALIVAVGERTFAVPMPSVREAIEILPERLTLLEQNEIVAYRGGVLPLIRLARRLRLAESAGAARYALVVGSGLAATGIAVDRIIDKREIVVRTLADPLLQIDGLAGATEMGDGRPILILDAQALTRTGRPHRRTGANGGLVDQAGTPQPRMNGGEQAMAETQRAGGAFVLCELAGATYGIPSQLVRQIEMVEQITPVPNAPSYVAGIIFSRGQVIPAIDLRARFGFEKIAYTLRSRLIVIGVSDRTIGLIVDTAREFVAIPDAAIQPPPEAIAGLSGAYLKGLAQLGERLVVLLDLDAVIQAAETVAPVHQDG